jgi:hypothetical protein
VIGTPYRRHNSMVGGSRMGVTTNWAPARMADRAVSASSTVPTPIAAVSPHASRASEMTFRAFGVVMVTSMQVSPPSCNALTTSISSALLDAAKSRPHRSPPSAR